MADETGNAKGAAHTADKSAIIGKDVNLGELPIETKEKYLRRIKAEKEAESEGFQTVEKYLEVTGKKVLIKEKNKLGSLYTFYWFNHTKHPDQYALIKQKGGAEIDGQHVPLKFIDNKQFVAKKATR